MGGRQAITAPGRDIPAAIQALAAAVDGARPLHVAQEFLIDPEVLVFELRDLLFRGWTPVGHASQLQAVGSHIVCDIATRSFLIVRQEDGTLCAFRNRCLHAGFPLMERGDEVSQSRIVCKFHDWRYDLGGRVVHAPQVTLAPNVPAPCLKQYPVRERRGLVYLAPAANPGASLAEPPPMDSAPEWLADQVVAAEIVCGFDYNWKALAWRVPSSIHDWIGPAAQRLQIAPMGALAWLAADREMAVLVRLIPDAARHTKLAMLLLGPQANSTPTRFAAAQLEASKVNGLLQPEQAMGVYSPGSPGYAFFSDYIAALRP